MSGPFFLENIIQKISNSLIIIPTFNEAENITIMIELIFRLYPKIHLLIIDDTSPDLTYELVKKLQEQYQNLHLIVNPKKQGIGKAYIEAFTWAIAKNYSSVVTMDCDFSHDPKIIGKMIELMDENQVVIGSRYINQEARIENWPLKRLILSKFAAWYSQFWTWMPVRDPTGGFNCYSIEKLKLINLKKIESDGYCFQVELKYKLYKLGVNILELPITFLEREKGKSKLDRKIVWEAILKIPFLRLRNSK